MNCNANCNCNYTWIGVLISAVLAAVVGVLFSFGYIPAITTAIWILFGLAILNLIFLVAGLYVASIFRRTTLARCLRCVALIFLTGIIGTIVMTLVASAITIVTTSIWIIVLISITAFFAALMVIELIALLSCITVGLAP